MKTKNAILGICAFVLAMGSAFASLLVVTPIRVKVKLTGNTPIQCIITDVMCDNAGTFACKVFIDADVGPDITSNTYDNPSCTVRLLDTDPTSTPKISDVEVYQLF